MTLFRSREAVLFVVIATMVIIVVLRAPSYLAGQNAGNILSSWGFLSILVLGQLGVLLTRGIDLSQASVLAFTGMFLALLSQSFPTLPAIAYLALGVLMGAALGLLNGAIIAIVGIPPIIATLGSMTIIRGMVYLLSDGAWVSSNEMSASFKSLAAGSFLSLPNVFLVAVICGLLVWLFLTRLRAGRNIYAYGGNPAASRYAGLSSVRIECTVYALSGALAGLCGYLWAGRYAIAYTQAAEGREFAIIAACVIGGISISGGRGSVVGALLGALFIAVLETALPFMQINPFLQMGVIGLVILIAIAANAKNERQSGRQILARTGLNGGSTE